MYIRRKVFSNIQVNESEVRTFSTTEYELDENLQARLFSKKEDKEKEEDDKKAKAKKAVKVAAAGTLAGAGVGAGAIGGEKLINKLGDKIVNNVARGKNGKFVSVKGNAVKEAVLNTGRKMANADTVKNLAEKGNKTAKNIIEKGSKKLVDSKVGQAAAKQIEKVAEVIAKNPKAAKALGYGGLGVAAAGAGTAAGIKLSRKIKEKKAEKK